MRALLLAAGLGSRLRPLTLTVPKCLVPIRGRPLLDYWLESLFSGGIDRVLLNTHWLAETVRDYVAKSRYRSRIDMAHERELLGTGGTIVANREWLGGGPFLVAHADNLTDLDFAGFIEAHQRRPLACHLTMLAFRTDTPEMCGIVEVGENAVVTAFHEKVAYPPGNLANAAVYVCEPTVSGFIASLGRPVVDFSTEVIPAFLNRIYVVETKAYLRDIGTYEALARAQNEFNIPSPEFEAGRLKRY